jgi:LytS/YehU family sensor histidine kinase
MWLGNGYLTNLLSRHFSWTARPLQRFAIGVVVTVLYTSLFTILILESLEALLGGEMSPQSYWNSFWITIVITALITVSLHAREFLLNWRQADLDRARLERAHVASQYEALRNQVNPHFLFNSLNVLTELVHQDAALAEKFINQLSKVYRYVLENKDAELVPLAEEVRFIESYLFLHQIRHGNALQVHWQLQDTDLQLPPMALQILVENALKHNSLTAEQPLHLSIRQAADTLTVENSFQPKTTKEAGTGTGLAHLQKRYTYLTDRPIILEESGTHYRVSLPLLTPTAYAPAAG